jgi:hypothetical protein
MFTKSNFPEYDGLYYVGNIVDIDGDGWVSEEQLELLIEELNSGVYDELTDKLEVVFRPELAYVPFSNTDNKINYIHLN